jgi:CBS domain-containing protein
VTIGELVEAQTLVCLSSESTVAEAAQIMSVQDIGCIVILQGQTLAGIFTERDLLNKVVVRGLDCQVARLADVMISNVVTITADVSLHDCYQQMKENGFRHLPVVEGGKVLGVISIRNLMDLIIQQ